MTIERSSWWLAGIAISGFFPPLFIGNSLILLFVFLALLAKAGNDETRKRERGTWK